MAAASDVDILGAISVYLIGIPSSELRHRMAARKRCVMESTLAKFAMEHDWRLGVLDLLVL